MPTFTGDESPADIMRLALEKFSKSPVAREFGSDLKIYYQDNIPFLMYRARVKDDLGEFVVHYRLDKMLLRVFPECETIYEEAAKYDLLEDNDDPKRRAKMVNVLASYAMNTMLGRLLLNQATMFGEIFSDTSFLTGGVFLAALGQAYQSVDANKALQAVKGGVRKMLDSRLEHSAKNKRDLLVRFVNHMPSISIPTGVGRPKGSTKPEAVKAQEAAEFEKQIEVTIRELLSTGGKMPTKTAVARALGIGGLNPNTGIDSSLQAFRNKLARLSVDYNVIVERVKLNK